MYQAFQLRRRCQAVAMAVGALGVAHAAVAAPDFDPRQAGSDAAALVEELSGQGIPRDFLVDTLSRASASQEVLDAMSGAAEYHMEWPEYRAIFMTDRRVEEGAAFMREHREALEKARAEYGVAPAVITAIIGVETYYGRHKGEHRVLDSLATLAFRHPQRGDFFRGELAAFLRLAFEQDVDPETLRGSYAGAMGYPQFIPTSYDAYAVDFDDDGKRDLWHNPVDAIGSVAHYFAEHDWRAGDAVYQLADGPKTPPEGIELNQTSRPSVTLGEAKKAGITPVENRSEALFQGPLFHVPLAQGSLSQGAFAQDPERWVVPLRLAMEEGAPQYRLGGFNFYVITRYNHSHLYAMAVAELAEAIADAAAHDRASPDQDEELE
ncbi:MAG: lytic murein transglycosylase B [Halomonas subglaciescola]|nr:lytic murein transglycosylase B [Halomonas subglaciescola]